jgi:hypothetical protein
VSPFQLTSAHSRMQVLTPAANMTVKLPGDVLAGEPVTIRTLANAFETTIASANGTVIRVIRNAAQITLIPLINNPQADTDWSMTDYKEYGNFTLTSIGWTGGGQPVTVLNNYIAYVRTMEFIHLEGLLRYTTAGTTITQFQANMASFVAPYGTASLNYPNTIDAKIMTGDTGAWISSVITSSSVNATPIILVQLTSSTVKSIRFNGSYLERSAL